MSNEGRRGRWRRALTAAELAAVAGFVVLVLALYEGQFSLSGEQIAITICWYLVLGVPLLCAHMLWKARATWPTPPSAGSRWGWWVAAACIVIAFTSLEYSLAAYLIPGLRANTNLFMAAIMLVTVSPVLLMWGGIRIAVNKAKPSDEDVTHQQLHPPRSR